MPPARRNAPKNPKLWSQAQAQARKKFTVHPSAYSNAWAVKWYTGKGGQWKTVTGPQTKKKKKT
jgi:hypothetical protein